MFSALISVALYLVAIAWSVTLIVRTRIWRLSGLPILLLLLALPQLADLLHSTGFWQSDVTFRADVFSLCLSLVAFLTVVFLEVIVSEQRRAEERLAHGALHDTLTGLPNRAVLNDRLDRLLERQKRNTANIFCLLFMDLDGFKSVNDSYGHAAGDQMLVEVSRRILSCLRDTDTLARLGGDEFTVLLDSVRDISDAMRVAQRIQKSLSESIQVQGQDVYTGVSIGIALSTTKYQQPEEMIRDADTAMYRAKAAGKRRIEVFDAKMHTESVRRLELETELRKAVERGDFTVYYQPIVAMQTGRISGFEALVRWRHAERGIISPAEFIPLAEDIGVIHLIDRWVLRSTCHDMKQLQEVVPDGAPLSVSVNVSSMQFRQGGLVEEVRRVMEETAIDPKKLRLEITESVVMHHAESTLAVITQLKSMDVELHLDDFGTGYSSLSYLYSFDMDRLKIDRSFITQLDGDRQRVAIVQSVIELAHTLGMQVTAEGIETREQYEVLKGLGCDSGQGYYFAKPLQHDDARQLLAKSPCW